MTDDLVQGWASHLAVGSAQFGLDYGISNTDGRVDSETVLAILTRAAAAGIDLVDTAAAYGNSEQVVGAALTAIENPPAVVSKLIPGTPAVQVGAAARASLARIGGDQFAGYLLHNAADGFDVERWNEMERLVEDGITDRVGVSVYHPQEVRDLWASGVDFSIVQLPLSVFDQRFVPLLLELAERKVEVHVRSVFLQGLYFLPDELLPAACLPALDSLRQLRSLAAETAIPLSAILLGWVVAQRGVDRVVVGVTSVSELEAHIDGFAFADRLSTIAPELTELAVNEESVVLPYLWNA